MKDGQKENPTNNKMMRWGGGTGKKKGPIGQEIKCAVSQWRRRCHSRVSQVIAYCLLPSEKVRGHDDHIYFSLPPTRPILLRAQGGTKSDGGGGRGMGRAVGGRVGGGGGGGGGGGEWN